MMFMSLSFTVPHPVPFVISPLSMTKESVALASPQHTTSRHVVVCNWNPIKLFERKKLSAEWAFITFASSDEKGTRIKKFSTRSNAAHTTHRIRKKLMRLHHKKEAVLFYFPDSTKVVITCPFSGLFTSILLTYLYPLYHLILCEAFKCEAAAADTHSRFLL